MVELSDVDGVVKVAAPPFTAPSVVVPDTFSVVKAPVDGVTFPIGVVLIDVAVTADNVDAPLADRVVKCPAPDAPAGANVWVPVSTVPT